MAFVAARVLVIGLDCADPGLLKAWLDAGELPALQSLRARGAWGPLRSPPALADDATWASFYTGVSPARHGRYFFHAFEPGAYGSPFWHEKHLQYRPFWETLDAAGRRIAIVDVPKAPLSTHINGVQVTDWRVHGRDRRTQSQPPAVCANLKTRFHEDRTDCLDQRPWLCDERLLPEERYDEFLAGLVRSAEDKLEFSEELLAQGNWDLFLVVFKEAHCVSHKFWHLLDRANPGYSERFAPHYRDAIRSIFRRLDAAIGRLLEIVGPQCNVIVFSDLGMASNYTGNFLLDEILRRLEYRRLGLPERIARGARELAASARARLRHGSASQAMRRHRLCFALPNGEQSGAIRFNLVGREPNGLVRPGAEHDALCEYLVGALTELVDADTGTPIVASVLPSAAIYPGPHNARLPDLFVEWRRERPICSAASALIGEIRVPYPGIRSGGHVADGLYCIAGPAVRHARSAEPASIMDLAPTIGALLGHPLPELDGKPLPALGA